MYISKKIVDAHDGQISVFSSGQGHGCTFTIDIPVTISDRSFHQRTRTFGLTSDSQDCTHFPINQDEFSEMIECGDQRIKAEEQSLPATFHFLIVDDSSVSRKMLIKYIRSLGYVCDFDEAENGIEAVEKVELALATSLESQKSYDAIFMDNIAYAENGRANINQENSSIRVYRSDLWSNRKRTRC